MTSPAINGSSAVKELRALHPAKPALVGHYDSRDVFEQYATELNAQGYHIYSPINPIKPELITGLNESPAQGNAAGEAAISHRTWLPYDIDAVRPKNATATDEQRQAARAMADSIMEFWSSKRVVPRLVDSGNGYQVLVPINLPNDSASTALVKSVLQAHKARFDTPGAKLDVLFDAPRIMRVPGFKNWKGEGPHREVRVLFDSAGLATRDMLEAIAPAPTASASTGLTVSAPNNYPKAAHSKDVVERVLGYSPAWREARAPHLWMADLEEELCPNAEQHSQGNVRGTFIVTIARDGSIGAKCNHANCADIGWVHVRAKREEEQRRESLEAVSDVLEGPDGLNLTAMGNMERLLQKHGKDLKWTRGRSADSLGTFYCWTGTRWEADINSRVRGLAQALVRSLGGLVVESVRQQWSADKVKVVANFWRASESDGMTRDIVSLLRPHIAVDRGKFDGDPLLLGVKNGVVDLRDGSFREARREDLITKQANVNFDKGATCPLWMKFLETTTAGRLDLLRYLAQSAGICLSGLTEEHLFFIVLGPGGTGKTTFQETLKYVWGDYCCGIDPNSLAASGKPEAAKARPDLAKLPGMRMVFANESRAGMRLDEGLLKAMTGSDTMTARELYQAEFDFVPTHKIWLRTNSAPLFDGGDSGMQRRVRLVPFDHVVESKDPKLPEKLRAEAAGILNWALAGLRDYQQNGLIEPAIVTEGTREYVEGLDHIKQFIEAKCETGPAHDQPAGELHAAYSGWCLGEQLRALGIRRFGAEMQQRGFAQRTLQGRRIWTGLRLAEGAHRPGW